MTGNPVCQGAVEAPAGSPAGLFWTCCPAHGRTSARPRSRVRLYAAMVSVKVWSTLASRLLKYLAQAVTA